MNKALRKYNKTPWLKTKYPIYFREAFTRRSMLALSCANTYFQINSILHQKAPRLEKAKAVLNCYKGWVDSMSNIVDVRDNG